MLSLMATNMSVNQIITLNILASNLRGFTVVRTAFVHGGIIYYMPCLLTVVL